MRTMRKKVISLVSVMLVGALMLSFCGCLEETKKGEKKMKAFTLPQGWTWYENEAFGIRLAYPEKWKVEPHP